MKTVAALLSIIVSTMVMAYTAAATPNPAPVAPAITPTVSPTPTITPTPGTPIFEATMTVLLDRPIVAVGEELLVTIDITVSEGCMYPVYELELLQAGDNAPLFAYLDPPRALIGPGVPIPRTYRLIAARPGEITFDGRAFGERYCNDFWNWTYVSGSSESVRVEGEGIGALLPVIVAQ